MSNNYLEYDTLDATKTPYTQQFDESTSISKMANGGGNTIIALANKELWISIGPSAPARRIYTS